MDGCKYCNEDVSDSGVSKDIFFDHLKVNPFGIEDDNLNPDITVYISDTDWLRMTVMMQDHVVLRNEVRIKYCPFCGRRLRG